MASKSRCRCGTLLDRRNTPLLDSHSIAAPTPASSPLTCSTRRVLTALISGRRTSSIRHLPQTLRLSPSSWSATRLTVKTEWSQASRLMNGADLTVDILTLRLALCQARASIQHSMRQARKPWPLVKMMTSCPVPSRVHLEPSRSTVRLML